MSFVPAGISHESSVIQSLYHRHRKSPWIIFSTVSDQNTIKTCSNFLITNKSFKTTSSSGMRSGVHKSLLFRQRYSICSELFGFGSLSKIYHRNKLTSRMKLPFLTIWYFDSNSKRVPHFFEPKVHHRVHTCPPLGHILGFHHLVFHKHKQ